MAKKMAKIKSNPSNLIKIADFDINQSQPITTIATIQSKNGKSAKFELAVDTGCYPIILDKTLFDLLLGDDLSLATNHTIIDTSGSKTIVKKIKVRAIIVGGVKIENCEILVKDMAKSTSTEGILGRKFFRDYLKLYFDFIDGTVIMEG